MARGPLFSSLGRSQMVIGSLPGREGIWLYELDCDTYRVLAQVRDRASAERILEIRMEKLYERDLEEGFDCDNGAESSPELPRQHSSLLNGLL